MKRILNFTSITEKVLRGHWAILASALLVSGCTDMFDKHLKAASTTSSSQWSMRNSSVSLKVVAIPQKDCASCHENSGTGGVSNITDPNHLLSTNLILPGNPLDRYSSHRLQKEACLLEVLFPRLICRYFNRGSKLSLYKLQPHVRFSLTECLVLPATPLPFRSVPLIAALPINPNSGTSLAF